MLGIGLTASYLSWVPIFGVAFGVIFMGETLTMWHIIGGALVVLGSAMVALSKHHK